MKKFLLLLAMVGAAQGLGLAQGAMVRVAHVYYHVKDVNVSSVIASALSFYMLGIKDSNELKVLTELLNLWNRKEEV